MINSLMVLIVLYSSSSIRRILYRALYRRCRRDMVNSSKVFCLLLRLLRFVAFVELNTTFHIIHHILDNFRKSSLFTQAFSAFQNLQRISAYPPEQKEDLHPCRLCLSQRLNAGLPQELNAASTIFSCAPGGAFEI